MGSMKQRYRLPEVMDDPVLEASRHIQALRGLERLNRWSRSERILWGPIQSLAQQTGARSLRVLDIAAGGGDVPIRLWRRARRMGLHLRIDGCDRSSLAVQYAQGCVEKIGTEVKFFELDALTGQIPSGYDILMSSLFLHHLDDGQAVQLLRTMAQAAERMVLISDLARSLPGLWLAYVGTRLLSQSEVVRTDGPRSVRAAYTMDEVCGLAQQAGLHDSTVVSRWPCRFLLEWRRR